MLELTSVSSTKPKAVGHPAFSPRISVSLFSILHRRCSWTVIVYSTLYITFVMFEVGSLISNSFYSPRLSGYSSVQVILIGQ